MTIRGANPNAGTGESAYYAPLEAQHGIQLLAVKGGLIEDVEIYDVYGDFVYMGMGGSNRVLTSDVTVQNSRFERKGRMGVAFTGAEDILVENNHIRQSRRAMFDIEPEAFDLSKAVIEPRRQDAGALRPGLWPRQRPEGLDRRLLGRGPGAQAP